MNGTAPIAFLVALILTVMAISSATSARDAGERGSATRHAAPAEQRFQHHLRPPDRRGDRVLGRPSGLGPAALSSYGMITRGRFGPVIGGDAHGPDVVCEIDMGAMMSICARPY